MDPDLIDMAFEDRISGYCTWDETIEDWWDGPTWDREDYWDDLEDDDAED